MDKKAIRSAKDFEDFFRAFNEKKWDELFKYLSEDCIWNASEKRLQGRAEMEKYWTEYHGSIKEILGKPQNVVFGEDMAYLEVPIRLEFLADGSFFGKRYSKGSVLDFWAADVYTFAQDGTIAECRIYSKFNR